MEFTFLSAAGVVLFTRSDAESAHWVQEEMSVSATFPFVPGKEIERGQRIAFRDPATDTLEVFEIRSVSSIEPDHYQQITAESIAISELQDEHVDKMELSNVDVVDAMNAVLTGTSWRLYSFGMQGETVQNIDIQRGSVWQAVQEIARARNLYVDVEVVISSAGAITAKRLNMPDNGKYFNGIRLSVSKNLYDPSVTYNDEDVLTALYGYGGSVEKPQSSGDDKTEELTFADTVWTATADHPAKPSGQTYLEDPAATALYGRNGRARYGYYQNANIKDPAILLQKTWEALKRTNKPKISISGTAEDLYRLGYHDEPLKLHDLAIVEIEETGETFRKEIIRLDVDLIDPTGNRVDIGDYIPNIVYINRDTAEKAGGGGGGGGRGQTPNEAEQVQTFTEFVKTSNMIGMVVGMKNGGYYVKGGEIVLAINEDAGSTAKIQADTIDIDGIITSLEARSLTVGSLHAAGLFDVNVFTFGNQYVTWQDTTVVTSVTAPSLSRTASFTVTDKTGIDRTGRLVTSWSAGSSTTKTIHYLGKAAT